MSVPRLILPRGIRNPDIEVTVYADASGGADQDRSWACVIALGDEQKKTLRYGIRRLKTRYPNGVDQKKGELKLLPTSGMVAALDWLRTHDLAYFPYEIPSFDDPRISWMPDNMEAFLLKMKPHSKLQYGKRVARMHRRLLDYLTGPNHKPVNRHKFVSLMCIANRLAEKLKGIGVAGRVKAVTLYVDEENFPLPTECAWGLKWLLVGSLQKTVMHCSLNGDAPFESPFRGNVRVKAKCPSHRFSGIQFADIVARAARNRVLNLLP